MASTEVLVVLDDRGRRHLVSLGEDMARIPGLGVLSVDRLRKNLGRRVTVSGRSVVVLPASRLDLIAGLERRPQTIGAKDAAAILFCADITPEAAVVEAGTGSGWLTLALAAAVGPSGRVITYEMREDFASLARGNLARAGMLDRVEIRSADIRKGIPDRDLDACVLDLPDPWTIVPVAKDPLRVGGAFASFSPNVEQVRQTVAALRGQGFIDIRTIELIERELVVGDMGTRPSFAALGHTGYLTFARKVLESFEGA